MIYFRRVFKNALCATATSLLFQQCTNAWMHPTTLNYDPNPKTIHVEIHYNDADMREMFDLWQVSAQPNPSFHPTDK